MGHEAICLPSAAQLAEYVLPESFDEGKISPELSDLREISLKVGHVLVTGRRACIYIYIYSDVLSANTWQPNAKGRCRSPLQMHMFVLGVQAAAAVAEEAFAEGIAGMRSRLMSSRPPWRTECGCQAIPWHLGTNSRRGWHSVEY